MKKLILFLMMSLSMAVVSYANHPHWQPRKLDKLKVAYIQRELELSQEEAQKFWPTYNNYLTDLRKSRATAKQDVLEQEEELLLIRKKYRDEFRRILATEARANKALMAERNFNNMIRKELQKRMEKRGGPRHR